MDATPILCCSCKELWCTQPAGSYWLEWLLPWLEINIKAVCGEGIHSGGNWWCVITPGEKARQRNGTEIAPDLRVNVRQWLQRHWWSQSGAQTSYRWEEECARREESGHPRCSKWEKKTSFQNNFVMWEQQPKPLRVAEVLRFHHVILRRSWNNIGRDWGENTFREQRDGISTDEVLCFSLYAQARWGRGASHQCPATTNESSEVLRDRQQTRKAQLERQN